MEKLNHNQDQCLHRAFVHNKCKECGKTNFQCGKPPTVRFRYIQPGLTLTLQEINHRRDANLQSLLRRKKLKLILDLDNTLLHARLIHKELTSKEKARLETLNDLHYIYYGSYVVKLRPGVREFLDEVSLMFDLSVFTLGSRDYATRIVRVLNRENGAPRFKWVMAMEDCLKKDKKGLDAVLWDERVVLIVDDTELVWVGESGHGNLVKIRAYNFNPMKVEAKEMDKELARVLSVLREVHKLFYDEDGEVNDYGKKDVRKLLRRVLFGKSKALQDVELSMRKVKV